MMEIVQNEVYILHSVLQFRLSKILLFLPNFENF